MSQNYRNLSTWREQTVKIKPGLNTVDFIDTRPNMFIIQNPTAYQLKVGIGRTPSEKSYEFLIAKNCNMPIGRPLPTSALYIWHDGNTEHDITVYSIDAPFDINILQNAILNMECVVETDGLIKGFAPGVSLPGGINNIGRITIEDFDILAKTWLQNEMSNMTNTIKAKLPELVNVPAIKNGMYDIAANTPFTLYDDGNVIFDQIEMITNNGDSEVSIDVYFTDTDFCTFHLIEHDFFSSLKMPCVRIVVNSATDTQISVFGYTKGGAN